MPSKVAVVILNWNGRKFLERFLPSVVANSPGTEIIIADNASSDDSLSWLKDNYPRLRVIVNERNWGFARGYNEALKLIEADYYLLLNSDIEVPPGWLDPLVSLMDDNTEVAACQPKIISFHHPGYFEYAGAAGGFIDRYGYPFCRGRIFTELEADRGQYDDLAEVFWATGACLMVRASCYHEVGGMDNDFFAHMEEIDLCWRLKNAGYKVMASGASEIYHVGGGTLPKKSSRKTYLNFRNNFILLYKNLPASRIPWVFSLRILLDWIAAIKFLAEGGLGDFGAVIKAHWHFLLSVPRHHAKRKAQPSHTNSGVYNRSIVFDFWFKKRKRFTQLSQHHFTR